MIEPNLEDRIKETKIELETYGHRYGQETILEGKAVLLAMSADNNEVSSASYLCEGDIFTIPADESTFNERFVAYKSRNQENYSIDFLAAGRRSGRDMVLRISQCFFMRGYRLAISEGNHQKSIIYSEGEPAEDFRNAYSCAYFAFSALRGKTIKVIDTFIRECWLPKRDFQPPYSYGDYEKRMGKIYTFQYIDSNSSERQSRTNNCLCSHKNDIALTHYEFPDNEQTIMNEAFSGCKNLSEIEISYGIKTIGELAFGDCSALEQIDIPETVERIGAGVFCGCSNLEAIHVSKRNRKFFDVDGILFRKPLFLDSENKSNQNTEMREGYLQKIICYPLGKKDKILEVNIDQDLCIGSYAFARSILEEIRFNSQVLVSPASFMCSNLCKIECSGGVILGGYFNDEKTSGLYCWSDQGCHFSDCYSLRHIKLSDKNLYIPTYCFWNSGLESIELPQNIISIGDYAFSGCDCLHSIEFSCAALRSIGGYAFSGCKAITEITLPNSLETIGDYAFSDGSSISNITLPPNLKMIGDNAFLGCCSVESIVIPPSVKFIGVGAFAGCSSLKHIKICVSLSQITIKEKAFDGVNSECIVEVPEGEEYNFSKEPSLSYLTIANLYSAKTEITIAAGETTIAEGEYLGSPLAKIVIPEGITAIGIKAFSLCRRATDIVFPRSLSTIEAKAFADSCAISTIISNMVSLDGVSANAFDGINRENCTIYVPIGCRTLYSRHPAFQRMNIVVDRDLG